MTDPEEGGGRWDGWLGPRQWGPLVAVFAITAIALGVLLATRSDSEEGTGPGDVSALRQPVHWHADFAVFIRGQQFDFNQPQFVSTVGSEKSETVHIHDPRHTVIHVHREGSTWDEFFRSLGFLLDDPSFAGVTSERTCLALPSGEKLCNTATETLKFYVNGVKVDGIANLDISDLDRVLVSYGPETHEEVVRTQLPKVSDEACIPSELCSERFPEGGIENEPCSKSGSTCTK